MSIQVVLIRHGYYELAVKPSAEELSAYYAEKYYQQSIRTHRPEYSADEIRFRRAKLEQKRLKAEELRCTREPGRFLDVGAGEAFAMRHFADHGWRVTGLDYSSHGCATHHPELLDHLKTGDILTGLAKLVRDGLEYDFVLLDNVLEHVLDPLAVLKLLGKLLAPGGLLAVEVPNDFSALQERLLEDGKIGGAFWVVVPDHISYFNADGLTRLAEEAGLQRHSLMGDFPIDFFLMNDHSNYVLDRSRGKAAHQSRVALDLLMHEISPARTNALYEALAALGLGRQIIAFFGSTEP